MGPPYLEQCQPYRPRPGSRDMPWLEINQNIDITGRTKIIPKNRSKKGKPMSQRLASELLDAYNETGGAMTTRENIHRMAEANKAFAHFAW